MRELAVGSILHARHSQHPSFRQDFCSRSCAWDWKRPHVPQTPRRLAPVRVTCCSQARRRTLKILMRRTWRRRTRRPDGSWTSLLWLIRGLYDEMIRVMTGGNRPKQLWEWPCLCCISVLWQFLRHTKSAFQAGGETLDCMLASLGGWL